jgi:hypothetical protein
VDVGNMTWLERRHFVRRVDEALAALDSRLGTYLDKYGLSAEQLEREIEHGGRDFEPTAGEGWRGF